LDTRQSAPILVNVDPIETSGRLVRHEYENTLRASLEGTLRCAAKHIRDLACAEHTFRHAPLQRQFARHERAAAEIRMAPRRHQTRERDRRFAVTLCGRTHLGERAIYVQ
jgi:hypothetical protein